MYCFDAKKYKRIFQWLNISAKKEFQVFKIFGFDVLILSIEKGCFFEVKQIKKSPECKFK
jgi:hypothetical protein